MGNSISSQCCLEIKSIFILGHLPEVADWGVPKQTTETVSVNVTKYKSASKIEPSKEPMPPDPSPVICCPPLPRDPHTIPSTASPPEIPPTPNMNEETLKEIRQDSLASLEEERESVKHTYGEPHYSIPVIKPHPGISLKEVISANLGVDITPQLGIWKDLQQYFKIRPKKISQKEWRLPWIWHAIFILITFLF